jgi:hypothetical protein
VPTANTLVRWVNENAFAPIVRARPCPAFGRPVHRRGSPHRLRPGTSPHTLRIPPHGGHPVLRSNTESGFRFTLAVSSFRFRARLGFSIPSLFSGQRGISPLLDTALLIRAPEGLQPSRTMRCSAPTTNLSAAPNSPVWLSRVTGLLPIFWFHCRGFPCSVCFPMHACRRHYPSR